MKEKIKKYLEENFNEGDLMDRLDDEINNWVDAEELEEYDGDTHEAYINFSNGEAEDVIKNEMTKEILENLKLEKNHKNIIFIDELISDMYEFLDS